MLPQKDAFASYQKIRFANQGDEVQVKQLEALLKEHPDFFLKDKIQAELGYAYARMDKHKQSYLAFQALSQSGKPMSAEHMKAYQAAALHFNETSRWGFVVLGVVLGLWGVVLLGKPWRRITRRALWKLLAIALAWVALNVARMPGFYTIETTGYPVVIPDTVVYTGIALNLTVIVWLFLFETWIVLGALAEDRAPRRQPDSRGRDDHVRPLSTRDPAAERAGDRRRLPYGVPSLGRGHETPQRSGRAQRRIAREERRGRPADRTGHRT